MTIPVVAWPQLFRLAIAKALSRCAGAARMLALIAAALWAPGAGATEAPKILILNSYHQGFP